MILAYTQYLQQDQSWKLQTGWERYGNSKILEVDRSTLKNYMDKRQIKIG